FFIAAAEEYSKNFLKGFTADGYCSEGLGYWNYGFGYYIMLSETIYQATKGKVDLLRDPKVKQIATFGSDIEILNGVYPAFADCSVRAQPSSRLMYFVSRRFGSGLRSWEHIDAVSPSGSLYQNMMYSFPNSASRTPPAQTASKGPGIRSWFENAGVLICRPSSDSSSRLAVALKGGHNSEHHNHNDVGSFIVVLGDKPLLLDPGGEVYTARTFSGQRYESNVLNSFGHPVPIVAGKLQRTGSRARGRVVSKTFTDSTDTLVLDISSAYEVPELKKLERKYVYSRLGSGSLQVTDEVIFSQPCDFGTALITFGDWKQTSPSTLIVYDSEEALRVEIKVDGADFEIRPKTIEEDVSARKQPTRLGINLKGTINDALITLKITPTKLPGR
ncbi:MAG: heparinase II/III family protein, partial [Sedimentisphaerales bacterium]